MDIIVAIFIFFTYCLIVYRMLHLKRKWHICGTQRNKSKCCQGHLQSMKFQKIRILTLMHCHLTSGSDPNH
jgi:hypothetical protein